MVVTKLLEFGVPFTDVGMGVYEVDQESSLSGVLRVTTCTSERTDASARIDLSDGGADDVYSQNIQLAELNAMNAALAVLRWKRLVGFYIDARHEHHTMYHIDANLLTNEFEA